VLIDCAGADEVDVSFIQLLIAARRAAQRNGKQLRLAAPPEGALQAALTRAGFIFPGAGGSADGSAADSAGDHEDIWFAAAQP
jgi:anti-anti-sigma regulatory factor